MVNATFVLFPLRSTWRHLAPKLLPAIAVCMTVLPVSAQMLEPTQGQRDPIGDVSSGHINAPAPNVRFAGPIDLKPGVPVILHEPGAQYMKVHFTDFNLPEGATLEVADPMRREVYRYRRDARDAYTFDATQGGDGLTGFSAMSVLGDKVEVRLRGSTSTVWGPEHGVKLQGFDHRVSPPMPGGVCGSNDSRPAACYQVSDPLAYYPVRSVAMLIPSGCTAWRVETGGGANDRMLTSSRCLLRQADVSASEIWYDYSTQDCRGLLPFKPNKVPASQLLKVNAQLDYTLFTAKDPEQIAKHGALRLSARAPGVGQEIVIPGHPAGRRKELSVTSDRDGGNCRINSLKGTLARYTCDTEEGFSGAPVVDRRSGTVIALHSGRGGQCINQGHGINRIAPEIRDLLK